MKIILQIILLYSSFCLLSCTDSSTQVLSTNVDLIPLEVGNWWIYRTTISDSNSNTISINYDTMKLEKLEIFENKIYFNISNFPLIRADKWGYYANYKYKRFNQEISYFKYPANLNDEYFVDTNIIYNVKLSNFGFALLYYKVTKLDTLILVPNGKFKCIVYEPFARYKNNDDSITDVYSFLQTVYIKPGIGIVKFTYLNFDTLEKKQTVNKELIDYKLF